MAQFKVDQEKLMAQETSQKIKIDFSNAQSIENLNILIDGMTVQVKDVEKILRIKDFLSGIYLELVKNLKEAGIIVEVTPVEPTGTNANAVSTVLNDVKASEPQVTSTNA